MARDLAGFESWCANNPHPHQGGNWAWPGGSLCEELVNNAGAFTQTFPTAQAAANASGPLDPDPNTSRPGHFGYFYDGGAGHVLLQTTHGVLMASHFVNSIGPGIGYLGSIAEYEQKYAAANGHHIQFLGHTTRHGSETLAGISAASSNVTALTNPEVPDDMPRNYNAGGTIFTLGETFGTLWTNPADFSYLTNMAAWGAPVAVAMTPDQVATAINEANGRGHAYSQVGTSSTAALTAADIAAIDASLQAEFTATLDAIHGIPTGPTKGTITLS